MFNKINVLNPWRPIIAILRGITPLEAESVSDVLIEAGINIIEVPLNSPEPYETIRRMVKFHGDSALFGAGTVLNEIEVSRISDIGGKIIVSPNTNDKVINKTKKLNLLSFPGVFTASESFQALNSGADGLKFFPASQLMPNNFKSLSSVLPINTFSLAVGGVDVPNFKEWLDVGISGFGLGSNLYKQGMMLDEVKENAELIVKSYDNAILEY